MHALFVFSRAIFLDIKCHVFLNIKHNCRGLLAVSMYIWNYIGVDLWRPFLPTAMRVQYSSPVHIFFWLGA